MIREVTNRSYIVELNKQFNDILFQVLENQFYVEALNRNGVGLKKALKKGKLKIFYDKEDNVLAIEKHQRLDKRYFYIRKVDNKFLYYTDDEL